MFSVFQLRDMYQWGRGLWTSVTDEGAQKALKNVTKTCYPHPTRLIIAYETGFLKSGRFCGNPYLTVAMGVAELSHRLFFFVVSASLIV